MKHKDDPLRINLENTSPEVFLENYNAGIPKSFPKATREALKQFQLSHQSLFKSADQWSIDKHRKHLMDWLLMQKNFL